MSTLKLSEDLKGKVVLITGASRGIGKGIAKILSAAGASVYITGRGKANSTPAVEETANEINSQISNGCGKCIPVICDSGSDEEIKLLFDRISKEQNGVLDVLVNNAYGAVEFLKDYRGKKFWDIGVDLWDSINKVGLRSHYVASVYAAKMMVPRHTGVIINISSIGGLQHLFNPIYGVGKEAVDRMSLELAVDLKKENVCCFSLWPGAVKTEAMKEVFEKNQVGQVARVWEVAEEPSLTGKAILAILTEKNVMNYTNRVVIVADVCNKHGIYDEGDKYPVSMRSLKYIAHVMFPRLSWLFPCSVKVPGWLFTSFYSKF